MTFRNKIGLFYLLACCLLFSCHTPREDIGRIVGSTIVFPRQLITVSIGDDTSVPDTLALIKLVTYIDSDGCDDCSLKILRTWRGFVAEMDSVPSNIECVFIFAPKRIENLKSGLHVHRFDLPVFYDPDGAFERSNPQLPENPLFYTFFVRIGTTGWCWSARLSVIRRCGNCTNRRSPAWSKTEVYCRSEILTIQTVNMFAEI